jgi:hypothetical protein
MFAFLVRTNEGLLKHIACHPFNAASSVLSYFGKRSANTRNSKNCEILKHRLAGLFLWKFLQKLFHKSDQKLRRLFDRYNWQSKNIPSFPKYLKNFSLKFFSTTLDWLCGSKVRFSCECEPGCLLVVAPWQRSYPLLLRLSVVT